MKILTIFLALIFSVMFSSPSFADWKKVSSGVEGNTFYLDFERIKKHEGYIYYWELHDYLKLSKQEYFSIKIYKQGDCKLIRDKGLNWLFYKEPMGGGTSLLNSDADKDWTTHPPGSVGEEFLKHACAYAK